MPQCTEKAFQGLTHQQQPQELMVLTLHAEPRALKRGGEGVIDNIQQVATAFAR